ncbi:MAG: ABC transporter ATP-binding protein [Candidatus Saccharibacteria bacterium]|nr:ABC transporter ATP-binding protein [Candidatus Saccharibacteria bacterium]
MIEKNDKIAIKVDKVVKNFKLPHNKRGSLKSVFINLFKKQTFEKQHVLKGISFEVAKGEFFGIVGRNGSGKSTLLKILAGVYMPNSGRVNVDGKLTPFIELGVGFNPELTGRENVYLNGALLGFTNKQMDERYEDIVDFAELKKFMDQKLKNYSSGMQVRLAFSIATRANAPILLLDEVLAVGDAAFQRKCLNYFRELKLEKRTVILVSHDMSVVKKFCDRVALIEKGDIVAIGNPEKVADLYTNLLSEETQKKIGLKGSEKIQITDEQRWGDEKLKFENNVKISVTKKFVSVAVTILANEEVNMPIFGVSVKNHEATELFGTNSVRAGKKLALIKKGSTLSLKWTLPNIFNQGQYFIDLTAAHDSSMVVSDRWPEATNFIIDKIDSTPYVLDPEIQVSIN